MADRRKSKKAKQPLPVRIIKFIAIALGCAVLLAGIAERAWHYYRHVTAR